MNDPRRDRVNRMVLSPETWPLPHLPMKRVTQKRDGSCDMEFGVIRTDVTATNLKIRSCDNHSKVIAQFKSLDDLLAAGWWVD